MIENNPEVKYEKFLYRLGVMDYESKKVAGMYRTKEEHWILPEDIEAEKAKFLEWVAELKKVFKVTEYSKYCVGWEETRDGTAKTTDTCIAYIMGFLKV